MYVYGAFSSCVFVKGIGLLIFLMSLGMAGQDIGMMLARHNITHPAISSAFVLAGAIVLSLAKSSSPVLSPIIKLISFFALFIGICGFVSLAICLVISRRYPYLVYKPKPLESVISESVPIPEKAYVDVPLVAFKGPRCQTAAFLMMISKFGIRILSYCATFMLRYTIGASIFGEKVLLGSNPEASFILAAEGVGLRRLYYYTNDSEQFLRGIKYFISKGYPVRIPAMLSVLYQNEYRGEIGHTEVVVGYEGDRFYFYETGGKDVLYATSVEGIVVEGNTLAKSVEAFCKRWNLPWKYSLTVIVESSKESIEETWKKIYRDVKQRLMGIDVGYFKMGAYAFRAMPKYLLKEDKETRSRIIEWLILNHEELLEFFEKEFEQSERMSEIIETIIEIIRKLRIMLKIVSKDEISQEDERILLNKFKLIAEKERRLGELIGEIRQFPRCIEELLSCCVTAFLNLNFLSCNFFIKPS